VPLAELRIHLESIYAGLGDDRRFILGISDQAMPTSSWEHLKLAAELAKEHAVRRVAHRFSGGGANS